MNAFIACSSTKASHECKAKDMYKGDMFIKSYVLAKAMGADRIYILSAKYHLLHPNTVIKPYNIYLHDMSEDQKESWREAVIKQMKAAHIDFSAKTLWFAGEDYTKGIKDEFSNSVNMYKGARMGYILKYLDNQLKKHKIDPSTLKEEHQIMNLYDYICEYNKGF